MRALSRTTHFNFMGVRKLAGALSITLVVVSLASIFTHGLNFGIDFTGGVLVEIGYEQPVELDQVRGALASSAFANASVQHFGSTQDVLIRLAPDPDANNAKLSNELFAVLQASQPDVQLRRVEYVGPQVGDELTINGGLAMLWALGCIFVYVLFRFHWKFSAGAVLALAHDVIITLGVFSVLDIEFDLAVLAAILAVIGYSLNDTIVVFDRCRENFRRKNAGAEVDTINMSINEMLSRTLMTSGTTLIVLIALYTLGGETLAGFSLALILGVVVGTYSSIYVAGNASLAIGLKRDDLIPVVVEALDESGAQV